MKSLQIPNHSTGVAIASLLAAAASVFGPPPTSLWVWAVLVLAVALIGVPHGGLDHLTGRQLLAGRFPRRWGLIFFPSYLAVSMLIAAGWMCFPVVTAIAFFVASAWHFGLEDERSPGTSPLLNHIAALAVGGLVIWVPFLLHPQRITAILTPVFPADGAAVLELVSVTQMVACVLTPIAIGVFAWDLWRRHYERCTRNFSFVFLFATADPLISFGIYFCAWHSLRGLRRLAETHGKSMLQLGVATAPLSVGAIALAAVGMGLWSAGQSPSDAMNRTFFVALSAIAVPHLLLHGPMTACFGDSRSAGSSLPTGKGYRDLGVAS